MNKRTFKPNWAVAPGSIIDEHREAANMTQADLAERMGYSFKHVNRVIGGHDAVTPEFALKLESVFDMPAHVWLNIEAKYQEHLARKKEDQEIEGELHCLKTIPHRAMVKLGYVEDAKGVDMVRALRSFFSVASLSLLPDVWREVNANYRKSKSFESHQYALLAWLTQGLRLAANEDIAPFDKAGLKASLISIKKLSCLEGVSFEKPLKEKLAQHGVVLIFVPAPPGAHVSGATRWIRKDAALIQLSLRHKSDDQLWFTLFHELGHILLHSKKTQFIDFDKRDVRCDLETEADEFASNTLIDQSALSTFVNEGGFTADSIRSFARTQNVSPGIVVGRLQRLGHVPFGSQLNKLKQRFEFAN